jgi:hypothetical protein
MCYASYLLVSCWPQWGADPSGLGQKYFICGWPIHFQATCSFGRIARQPHHFDGKYRAMPRRDVQILNGEFPPRFKVTLSRKRLYRNIPFTYKFPRRYWDFGRRYVLGQACYGY